MDEGEEGGLGLSPIPENTRSGEPSSTEKFDETLDTASPLHASFNASLEDLSVTQGNTTAVETTPLRPSRKLPGTPSTAASTSHFQRKSASSAPEALREKSKSPSSLSELSSYEGSEASHAERRFLRLYEELEAHCMEQFPDFITPWYLRRINYGPCKTGDVVDLLRFLRPNGLWALPFPGMSVLDPYLAASVEKALYPNTENLGPYQKFLLDSIHQFIFSAYCYAQGLYFPFDGEWEEDKRDEIVDAFNEYTEDVVTLVQYIRHHGREASLRNYVSERSQNLLRAGRRRTFFFAQGGDTKAETEEYVFNLFLALLGLWTVGSQTCEHDEEMEIEAGPLAPATKRVDYSKMLPYRPALMENISVIRETFGLLVGSMRSMAGMDLIRSLQDFDAANITEGPFLFTLTRDISRHLAVDGNTRIISLFCAEAVAESDSPERLKGNVIAEFVLIVCGLMVRTLNLDGLDREHKLLHTLLFSSDESRQIAFSLGLVPPRKSTIYLRLSAFPNYAPHLTSLRRELTEWRPRHFKELFIKGWRTQNVWLMYALIIILTLLGLCLILAVTGTIGVWIILRRIIS